MTRGADVGMDADELARLADRVRPALLARAHRRHPRIPEADLEDIFGDTLEALLRRGEVVDAAHLEGALSIGVEFRAGHWHRRDWRTTPLDDAQLPEPSDATADPAAIAARRDEQALAIELLAELAPDEQRALKLRVGEDLSRSQAARAMAIDVAQLRRLERSGWRKLERIAAVAQAGRLCDARAAQAAAEGDEIVHEAVEAHLRRCPACRRETALRRAGVGRRAAGLLPLPVLLGAAGGHGGLAALAAAVADLARRATAPLRHGGVAVKATAATAAVATAGAALTLAAISDDDEERPPPRRETAQRTPPPASAAQASPGSRGAPSSRTSRRQRRRSAPGPSPSATPPVPGTPGPTRSAPRSTRPPSTTTPPRQPTPRPPPDDRSSPAPPPTAPTPTPSATPQPPPRCAGIGALARFCSRPGGPPLTVDVHAARPTPERPLISIGLRPR